ASHITKFGAARASYASLKQHPEIDILVGLSSLDGVGIVEGLSEISAQTNVNVYAFDALPETLHYIKSGDIEETIAQYPKKMGKQSIEVLIKLQERDLLEDTFYTGIKTVNQESEIGDGS